MILRFDHLVVAFVVAGMLLLLVFFVGDTFESRYEDKIHKYDSAFNQIEFAYRNGQFAKVIELSQQVAGDEDAGPNELKAHVYFALAKLKSGKPDDALWTLDHLITIYPPLEYVYKDRLAISREPDNVLRILNSILEDYIPQYDNAVTSPTTVMDILTAMDFMDWLKVFSIIIASVVVYERIVRKVTQDS